MNSVFLFLVGGTAVEIHSQPMWTAPRLCFEPKYPECTLEVFRRCSRKNEHLVQYSLFTEIFKVIPRLYSTMFLFCV